MTASQPPLPPVLVIDDSDIARAHMAEMLVGVGLVVHTLPSAIGATKTVLRHGIGVVVIDVVMPQMRGDHLASLFRKNARFNDVAVILVSSEPAAQLERIAREVGADAVVSKTRMQDLLPTIQRVVRGKKAANG